MTTREDYAKRLTDHLKETKSHARSVQRRIEQVGGEAETVSVAGPEGVVKAAERAQEVVGKAKAAAHGPMHALRGDGEQEKMLRNARTEYQEEAEEIATYTVIDALATTVGDKRTSKLARDILREEERMAKFLADLLPELSADFAHDEIPVSQIKGDSARRTARDSKPSSSTRSRSRSSSSSSRSSSSRSTSGSSRSGTSSRSGSARSTSSRSGASRSSSGSSRSASSGSGSSSRSSSSGSALVRFALVRFALVRLPLLRVEPPAQLRAASGSL
jgi:ferritin-like metal-binding protein YciE